MFSRLLSPPPSLSLPLTHTGVQVLTMQEYEEMLQPEPPKPTQLAKALFDFQGQSDREISFEKVHSSINNYDINVYFLL